MPQRTKTPPPPQDEVFMTIFYPYPQHANMEVDEDVERVARWLGSIVPPSYLNAFYHKPSARNTVIIEVSKTIEDERRKLLGQHTWKDILLNPSEGEKRQRSGIFYCVYNTIRDVQKEGWKRIDFEDTWFMPRDGRKHTSLHYDQAEWEGIVKADGVFRIPYPLSKRCQVPMEDPTNRGFCRPLPVDLFPIPVPPEMPKEVPGTLAWTKVKAQPEGSWAPPKAAKAKAKSQTIPQPNDQRGRTVTPRNNTVGPAVPPNHSGVNHKSPGTLPPNLVANGKGKGKEKAADAPSLDVDELMARTIAMDLGGEEGEDDPDYYGAGLEDVLSSAGIATSSALPPPDLDPIDHTGVGVHVTGVSAKVIVVENSLWGKPPEDGNKSEDKDKGEDKDKDKEKGKEKEKEKDKKKKDEKVLLCNYHGKVCSKGICEVYGKQVREQKEQQRQKELQEAKNRRDGPNNGKGGRGDRGPPRPGSFLLRGRGRFGRDSGPRFPRDENGAPRRANGNTPPQNVWSKPSGKPQGAADWGADNNGWSPSEMGESAKPVTKPDSDPSVNGDSSDEGQVRNAPETKGWSQSEVGGGSQADPWSGPGKAKGKADVKPGWIETHKGPNTTGAPLKSPAKPAWGNSGDAKNWTPSELGLGDSVSQRGDGDEFRKVSNMEPGKKSWAELVEDDDEMDFATEDEPVARIAPASDIGSDGDEGDSAWLAAGKGRGKDRGRAKAKSTTGWSDVTNEGIW